MAKKKNKCPLVMIEWEDSAQPMPSWQRLAELDLPGHILCASVGWLVVNNDSVKVLAPNMGAIDSPTNIQASGFMQIPTRCVISIKPLSE
jgi:hypothetical protein